MLSQQNVTTSFEVGICKDNLTDGDYHYTIQQTSFFPILIGSAGLRAEIKYRRRGEETSTGEAL